MGTEAPGSPPPALRSLMKLCGCSSHSCEGLIYSDGKSGGSEREANTQATGRSEWVIVDLFFIYMTCYTKNVTNIKNKRQKGQRC